MMWLCRLICHWKPLLKKYRTAGTSRCDHSFISTMLDCRFVNTVVCNSTATAQSASAVMLLYYMARHWVLLLCLSNFCQRGHRASDFLLPQASAALQQEEQCQGQLICVDKIACMQEVQVERLMEKAVAQSERPWLILLTTLSCVSAVLLTLILLRLQQGGHLF